MGIDEIRLQQRERQKQQIERRGEELYRIGDRNPATGRTQLIYPDGSRDGNGIKLYAADHQSGDPVLARRRSDGLWLLSGANPAERRQPISIFKDGRGYREGKLFDNPVQEIKRSGLLLIQFLWAVNPGLVWVGAVLQVGEEVLHVRKPTELNDFLPNLPDKPAIRLIPTFEDADPRQQIIVVDLQTVSTLGIAEFSIALEAYWLGFENSPIGPNTVTIRVSSLGGTIDGFTPPIDAIVLGANQLAEYQVELTVVGGVLGSLVPQAVGQINYAYPSGRFEVFP